MLILHKVIVFWWWNRFGVDKIRLTRVKKYRKQRKGTLCSPLTEAIIWLRKVDYLLVVHTMYAPPPPKKKKLLSAANRALYGQTMPIQTAMCVLNSQNQIVEFNFEYMFCLKGILFSGHYKFITLLLLWSLELKT